MLSSSAQGESQRNFESAQFSVINDQRMWRKLAPPSGYPAPGWAGLFYWWFMPDNKLVPCLLRKILINQVWPLYRRFGGVCSKKQKCLVKPELHRGDDRFGIRGFRGHEGQGDGTMSTMCHSLRGRMKYGSHLMERNESGSARVPLQPQ